MSVLNHKTHKDGSVTVRAPLWLYDPGVFHQAVMIAYPVDEWRCVKGIDMDWLGRWTVTLAPISKAEQEEFKALMDHIRGPYRFDSIIPQTEEKD